MTEKFLAELEVEKGTLKPELLEVIEHRMEEVKNAEVVK